MLARYIFTKSKVTIEMERDIELRTNIFGVS